MSTFILMLIASIAGYVASIYTWPRLRAVLVGIEGEIESLRQKLRDLEAKFRG